MINGISDMEGISVHGNCGGEKLQLFLSDVLCIIWLLVTQRCLTNKCFMMLTQIYV